MTSKYGFSVVAPISVTRPSSTAGSSASCWALLKRWISSRKKIVRRPPDLRSRARAITSRTSARPACTADSSSNAASACWAARRASVVLPAPGRAVQDHAVRLAGLERCAQRGAGREQVLLADELVERLRPHPRGERPVRRRAVLGRFSGGSNKRSTNDYAACPRSQARGRALIRCRTVRRAPLPVRRPRVGRIGADELRRPAGAGRAAARAVRRPPRLDRRAGVRGRQRGDPAAARARRRRSSRSTARSASAATPARCVGGLAFILPGLADRAGDRGGRARRRRRRCGSARWARARRRPSSPSSPRPGSRSGARASPAAACGACVYLRRGRGGGGGGRAGRRARARRLRAARARAGAARRGARRLAARRSSLAARGDAGAGVDGAEGRRALLRRRLRDHPADAGRRGRRATGG